ncbi:MAG: hypothetical protein JXA95_15660 [Spirochaetales bacterium]|nr:hypothetical protein [Spirochaetales bacterium]
MPAIDKPLILSLRMKRQNLTEPDHTPYDDLFRLMSPVPTTYWIEPGSPPSVEYRTAMDDAALNDRRRLERTIIKGRFRGGNVGYIFGDEFSLHRAAYCKEMPRFSETDEIVRDTIRREGGMNIGLIKELTGLLSKQIAASLQKMQKAFLVFEDQVDRENDRAFYLVEDEFRDLEPDSPTRPEAAEELIRRFFHLNVFADQAMIRSLTRFPAALVKGVCCSMVERGVLLSAQVSDGQSGYILAEDISAVQEESPELSDRIFILDLNDYYVKSHESLIKERFSHGDYKTLKYIMYRGEFIGALRGYFRFGPDDLEDVVLDLSEREKIALGPAIIDAIHRVYDPGEHHLKRFDGKAL